MAHGQAITARELLAQLKAHPDFPLIDTGNLNKPPVNKESNSEYPRLQYKTADGQVKPLRFVNPTAERPTSNRGASKARKNGRDVEASIAFSKSRNPILYELVELLSHRFTAEMKTIMSGDSLFAKRWTGRYIPTALHVPTQEMYKDVATGMETPMNDPLFRIKFDYSDDHKKEFKNAFIQCEFKDGSERASPVKTITEITYIDRETKQEVNTPFNPTVLEHLIKSGSIILSLWDISANISPQGPSFKIRFSQSINFIPGTGSLVDEQAELSGILDFSNEAARLSLAPAPAAKETQPDPVINIKSDSIPTFL